MKESKTLTYWISKLIPLCSTEDNLVVGTFYQFWGIIEKNVHIAPGTIICGNVKIGKNAFIGTGTKILPNTIVPEDSIISAGTILK